MTRLNFYVTMRTTFKCYRNFTYLVDIKNGNVELKPINKN